MSKKTGRPKEEGGHQRIAISVNNFTYSALEKVENKSKFIEQSIRPILKQFDPGEACEILRKIEKMISEEMTQAIEERNYDKVAALATLSNSFKEYMNLCSPCKEPHQTITVGGGFTVGNGNECHTSYLGLTLGIDDENMREITTRYGQDLIDRWLRKNLHEATEELRKKRALGPR